MTIQIERETADGSSVDIRFDPYAVTPDRRAASAVRFPSLDENSAMDFVLGIRKWNSAERYGDASTRQAREFVRRAKLDDTSPDLGYEEAFETMLQLPAFAMKVRLLRSLQMMMWDRTMRTFHNHAAKYLALMEATDAAGPGKLELDADLDLPDYTRHEIHGQPGGYVGDPFAGWAYHWALARGFYYQFRYDENFMAVAQNCPKPADGKVRRILDLGCGSGLTTTALKVRFPDAEVWGIDAGGPMVRYAHHRAVTLNIDVNFSQRLIEDNKFPDGYFDIVSSYILFHEVRNDAAVRAVGEIARVLRPGGVYNHVDTLTAGMHEAAAATSSSRPFPVREESRTLLSKANAWQNHRHNGEPWALEYLDSNFPTMLRAAGLVVTVAPAVPYLSPLAHLSAVKPL